MAEARIVSAMERIEAALARIEKACPTATSREHLALRAEITQAITEIDAVIAGLEA